MTRTIVLIAICKNTVWRETARYLKHYRMASLWNLEEYNKSAWKLIELYRKIEFKINNENYRISKFDYIEMIKNLEEGK